MTVVGIISGHVEEELRGVGHGGVALQLGTMVILKILSLILVSKLL